MTASNIQILNDQDLEKATGGFIVPQSLRKIREILRYVRFRNPSFESFYQRYKTR